LLPDRLDRRIRSFVVELLDDPPDAVADPSAVRIEPLRRQPPGVVVAVLVFLAVLAAAFAIWFVSRAVAGHGGGGSGLGPSVL